MIDQTKTLDPAVWDKEHREALYHYAVSRVRDAAHAEDLVQDTLLAAIKGKDRFSGRSTVRTWLFSILRHKIIDYIRKIGRETPVEDPALVADHGDNTFDWSGRWRFGSDEWYTKPGVVLEQKEFDRVLAKALESLPTLQRDAFVMKEMMDLSSNEICEALDITPSNLWVALHRARKKLQERLTTRWLETPRSSRVQLSRGRR
jgi:RNA polymerase sigma-70 factor (ECF subfamily)